MGKYSLEEIDNIVKKVIAEQLELETEEIISEEEGFLQKYGVNSIDALELLLLLEREFDVEIDDADLSAELLSSVHNISQYFEKLIEEK